MTSKTKIVVLHLKELIYTGIFVILGILFVILLVIMFMPKDNGTQEASIESLSLYTPGKYTTSIVINDTTVDVEVVVNSNEITSIALINLADSVTTMYPLMEPSLDHLAEQIIKTQSLENITYSDDNKYTSMVLLNAIASSLEDAYVSITDDTLIP